MAQLSRPEFDHRLGLFRGIVEHNLDLFLSPKWGGFKGPVIFQGCPKLFCHLATNPALCKAHQDELVQVDQTLIETLKEHPSANQLRFLDARSTLDELPPGMVYADDRHPCWIRTCSWDKECQTQLSTELEQMQKAYEIAFGNVRVFSEWYSKEILRYEEFKKEVEKESEEWRIQHNKGLKNYTNPPTRLQVRVGTAQQLLSQLMLNKEVLNKLINGVAEIQNSAPKPYDNNEAMCPELLSAWVKHLKPDVTPAPGASRQALRGPPAAEMPSAPFSPSEPSVDQPPPPPPAQGMENMAKMPSAPFSPSEPSIAQPPPPPPAQGMENMPEMPSAPFSPSEPSIAQPPAPPRAKGKGKKSRASAKSSLLRARQSSLPATGSSLVMPVAEEWEGIARRFDIPTVDKGAGANDNAVQAPPLTRLVAPAPTLDEWSQIAGRMDEASRNRFPLPSESSGLPQPTPLQAVPGLL
jgi:hypothetical protein